MPMSERIICSLPGASNLTASPQQAYYRKHASLQIQETANQLQKVADHTLRARQRETRPNPTRGNRYLAMRPSEPLHHTPHLKKSNGGKAQTQEKELAAGKLQLAVGELAPNRDPGPDQIRISVIKRAYRDQRFMDILLHLLTHILPPRIPPQAVAYLHYCGNPKTGKAPVR